MPRLLAELDWPVHTARLTLRPATQGDIAEIWAWRQDPRVGEYLASQPADLAAFASEFTAKLPDALVAELDGRIVGTAKVALEDAWSQDGVQEQARNQVAELGWSLDPAVQGRGLGTELAEALLAIAFDGLGVRRIVAHCFADNAASRRLMERLGLRLEAHYVAESLHRSGRWLDGMSYALLAHEWRGSDRSAPHAGPHPGPGDVAPRPQPTSSGTTRRP